jgi:hypothetical protein
MESRTGELLPQNPTDPGHNASSRLKTFTLIDTFPLTLTFFEGERIPVAAIF